jgi:hypothetical protein
VHDVDPDVPDLGEPTSVASQGWSCTVRGGSCPPRDGRSPRRCSLRASASRLRLSQPVAVRTAPAAPCGWRSGRASACAGARSGRARSRHAADFGRHPRRAAAVHRRQLKPRGLCVQHHLYPFEAFDRSGERCPLLGAAAPLSRVLRSRPPADGCAQQSPRTLEALRTGPRS